MGETTARNVDRRIHVRPIDPISLPLMSMSTPIAPTDVTAELTYSVDTGVKPLNESYGPGNVLTRNVGETEARAVRIRDGRPLAGQFALERNGFVLVEHATRVADFFDRERILEVYYREVEGLVKRVSGAQRVVAFDHTVRSGDD